MVRRDGSGSHLVTIPVGPHLSDALVSSPIVQGEDGSGAIPSGGETFIKTSAKKS